MTIHAPPPMRECAELIESTLMPRLQPLGVAGIDIVAAGSPGAGRYSIGYRAAPGAAPRSSDVADVVRTYFPGSLSCQMLQVVPIEKLRVPETDPSILEAQRKLRRPTWQMIVFFCVLGAIPVGWLLSFTLFSRGDLLVTAPLRGAGTAEARFTSNGEPIALWASLDGSGTGSPGSRTLRKILPVHYEIDVILDGKPIQHLSVDTQVSRPNQKLFCTMAPDCEIYLMEVQIPAGPVLLKVQGKPGDVVGRVDDMSLNVREGTFF